MNKLLVALIAGAFATVAAAQTAAPSANSKEKQADVKAATSGNPNNSAGQAATSAEQKANTMKSKDVSKMTTQEKKDFAKDVNKMSVNPNNSAGQAATAADQKANTAASKGQPKANAELKTKEGKKQLEKELQKKATP
jgi:hypothetical protein